EVQEARQLEDLPVGSPGEERRFFESGILVLPEQLEALSEARCCRFQRDSSLRRKRGGHEDRPSADGCYRLPCVMGVPWIALAYAVDPSDSTFAATAALIGSARFAFTSDICSRSGNCSACCASSSSVESWLWAVVFLIAMKSSFTRAAAGCSA